MFFAFRRLTTISSWRNFRENAYRSGPKIIFFAERVMIRFYLKRYLAGESRESSQKLSA